MQPVPEQKMGETEGDDEKADMPSDGVIPDFQPAQAFEPRYAREHEQAGNGGDVMRVEVGIEISAQGEDDDCSKHPE